MVVFNIIRPRMCLFLFQCRYISLSHPVFKEQLKSTKKFKLSSQQWLQRQINDVFVKQAQVDHFRCRSAYKLIEIDQKYKILRAGQTVVDLGCAPGSWTQVAVKATKSHAKGSNSLVVGIDLSTVHPLEGATLVSGDFTTAEAERRVTEALASRAVDVVLSDMAPRASGIKSMDHTRIVKLCYSALRFAQKTSSPGGSLVMKLFDGNESKQLMDDAKALYNTVRIVRPQASRKESSEQFLVCLNYKSDQLTTEKAESDPSNDVRNRNV